MVPKEAWDDFSTVLGPEWPKQHMGRVTKFGKTAGATVIALYSGFGVAFLQLRMSIKGRRMLASEDPRDGRIARFTAPMFGMGNLQPTTFNLQPSTFNLQRVIDSTRRK